MVKRTASPHIELEAPELRQAKIQLIKFSQKGMVKELNIAVDEGKGRFRKLAPTEDEDGVWLVPV